MIDVSKKIKTLRIATARAVVTMKPETIARINERTVPKGDPLEVAKVAAVQAAKNTSGIIPYCHPMPVDFVGVSYSIGETEIEATVTVKAIYKTGVEMEAMTGASVAALTLYDMLKMIDETMTIARVELVSKRGGKSDFIETIPQKLRAAVLVMSDTIAAGKKEDYSGRMIAERLEREGVTVSEYKIISDDTDEIVSTLIDYCDEKKYDLVMTTGGTGFSPRDNTPEAMMRVVEREIPGMPEAMRAYGQERTPYSMLSRAKAGIRGGTLIMNLPGSKKGVAEALDALFPALFHAFKMLWGGRGNHDK